MIDLSEIDVSKIRNPLTCVNCFSKDCEKTTGGTFDICRYGMSFINYNGAIVAQEPKVPLSTIAKNLRHEINPILQAIIEQTTLLDPTLTTKKIDLNNPLSLIIGSTVILDNFIQMITGVHEFHSTSASMASKSISVRALIQKSFNIYSIIKEEGRTKSLILKNNIPENYYITACSDFISYLIAIIVDNAWKYSIDDSVLTANISLIKNGLYSIKFINQSKTISGASRLFDLGFKADPNTKGFGYGLYWAKTLEHSYNEILAIPPENAFEITYEQIESQFKDISFQIFSLTNIRIDKE